MSERKKTREARKAQAAVLDLEKRFPFLVTRRFDASVDPAKALTVCNKYLSNLLRIQRVVTNLKADKQERQAALRFLRTRQGWTDPAARCDGRPGIGDAYDKT